MFPQRSGGEVVYLEQMYPKPRFMIPIILATCTVLISFVQSGIYYHYNSYQYANRYSASNAIVFAQYFLTALEMPVTPARQTTTALICVAVTITCKCNIMRLS